ncbi:MAG: hypothetical protein KF810_12265 [Rhizobiaceae bacterium]|nr:hypothetical protein [Rhizobiaceae bacterium]
MTEGKMTKLDELLGDPMIQMVMERDRVRPEDLRAMLERDLRRHSARNQIPPAHVIAACQGRSLCC